MSGFQPDHGGAEVRVSPNLGPRRDGKRADAIILHYTGMETGEAAEAWLCNPESEVSSHYIVHEDGLIVQMVREADRAWHAGAGSWHGETDMNSRSVGIEIVNRGHFLGYNDFGDSQVDAVIGLCRGISLRHGVPPERVLAHSDIAPARKADPGEKFPWGRLAASGIGHFVEPVPVREGCVVMQGSVGEAVERLQSMLALYGYGVEINGAFDDMTRLVVMAFQRHFRPGLVDGIADESTIETLHALLEALVTEAV
ncbi:MAG: N-acetylmuramoyl-L-alanine amidase [Hyphomicrobiales bacterium]|nr:N-acetylmuramoyl-L-alanine amidase [Hyphomicrobiales bacterium]